MEVNRMPPGIGLAIRTFVGVVMVTTLEGEADYE